MKQLLIFLSLFLCANLNAQKSESKLDLRVGLGASFLGTGDILAGMIENELNYQLNNTFSMSGSLAFGKSNYNKNGAATFFQLNANIYVSIFPKMKRNDLRIGTGFSYQLVSSASSISITQLPDKPEYVAFQFENRNAPGLNVILENMYLISEKLLIGAKVFVQPYVNGDINSGLLLKFGVRI